jgi:hypothetical protein
LLTEEESCTGCVAAESAGVLSVVALSIGAAVYWSPVFSDDDVHEARIRTPPRKMAANCMILFFIDRFILKISLHTGILKRSPERKIL